MLRTADPGATSSPGSRATTWSTAAQEAIGASTSWTPSGATTPCSAAPARDHYQADPGDFHFSAEVRGPCIPD